MRETEFVDLIAVHGGKAYIVGGFVRDSLMGRRPKDKDYVVCHISHQIFEEIFPDALRVGRSFPVYLVDIDGKRSEVAFGRQERKTGKGYTGFEVKSSPDISIEEDLFRRDTTMNAIAVNLADGSLIDPYNGRQDIEKRIIKPVSEHFSEDPVRSLRCARQAAELGFKIAPETYEAMSRTEEELAAEPAERIFNEMKRALMTPVPSVFFEALRTAGLLKIIFPELYALIGKTQPVEYHPEGDSWNHTMKIVDDVAARTDNVCARFCGLLHDIGKGVTPAEMLPHHYNHEIKGLDVLFAWNKRMNFPNSWTASAFFVIKNHMRAARLTKPIKILDLLLNLRKLRRDLPIDGFNAIIMSDHGSLPVYLLNAEVILQKISAVSGNDAPEQLAGRNIGDWVRSQQRMVLVEECGGLL